MPRTDSFPANRFAGRQSTGGRREGGGYYRSPLGDGEFKGRPTDDSRSIDHGGNKLDRLLEKFDKFDLWKEETDRRFETLDSALSRDPSR